MSLLDSIKKAVMEPDPEDLVKKPEAPPAKVAVPIPAPHASPANASISSEDRNNAVKILSERVFVGDTPYTSYRETFDALGDSIADPTARRKAAFKVVTKKFGVEKVAGAIAAHKQQLESERETFERSIENGGTVEKLKVAIGSKEQEIASLRGEIEHLLAKVAEAENSKDGLNADIAEELAKQARAKELFESAYKTLFEEIAEDEKLITR